MHSSPEAKKHLNFTFRAPWPVTGLKSGVCVRDNLLTEEMGHTANASSKLLKVVLKSPSNKFVCMEKRVHIKYNIMKKWSRNADYYNFQSNSGEKILGRLLT